MKTNWFIHLGIAGMLAITAARAAEPAMVTAPHVGVYDSRVVAFAHFWSAPFRQHRDALIAEARAEKKAGNMQRADELQKRLKDQSERSHLQVFSSAPADEAMAALKDKLPAIQKELGVVRLVSKWEEPALKEVPEANRIDATDRLAREFNPDERRRRTIEKMKASKPLPLWRAKMMLMFGGM